MKSVTMNPDLPQGYPDFFTQWSGDNVDHNIVNLYGAGTFHGLGIIMSTSCSVDSCTHYSFEMGKGFRNQFQKLPR